MMDKVEHLKLLGDGKAGNDSRELAATPLFTAAVLQRLTQLLDKPCPIAQFGLLAGDVHKGVADPRIFANVSEPMSVFICGSQGSGKSHTLSCLLENALMASPAAMLPHPLTAMVFHYDTFAPENSSSACEAAHLASSKGIQVRVLCAPTSLRIAKERYASIGNVRVEPLRLRESDLNTRRMLCLMAVRSSADTPMPLYLHVVSGILRDMRLVSQLTGEPFNYTHFRQLIDKSDLSQAQIGFLKQRLDVLESFMAVQRNIPGYVYKGLGMKEAVDWTPKPGLLTIVDLSCPTITADMACALFNVCLSIFIEQPDKIGRVIALDEAHKFMSPDSSESRTLTDSLLASIRLQRHIAARIFISTQEPTVNPALLDLCTVTIMHRFSSPDWLATLRKHIPGVNADSMLAEKARRHASFDWDGGATDVLKKACGRPATPSSVMDPLTGALQTLTLKTEYPAMDLFTIIVGLRVGEAVISAPSAIIGIKAGGVPERLNHRLLKVRIRQRVTADGGRSIQAE